MPRLKPEDVQRKLNGSLMNPTAGAIEQSLTPLQLERYRFLAEQYESHGADVNLQFRHDLADFVRSQVRG